MKYIKAGYYLMRPLFIPIGIIAAFGWIGSLEDTHFAYGLLFGMMIMGMIWFYSSQ